jgi:hypothetical protein
MSQFELVRFHRPTAAVRILRLAADYRRQAKTDPVLARCKHFLLAASCGKRPRGWATGAQLPLVVEGKEYGSKAAGHPGSVEKTEQLSPSLQGVAVSQERSSHCAQEVGLIFCTEPQCSSVQRPRIIETAVSGRLRTRDSMQSHETATMSESPEVREDVEFSESTNTPAGEW